MKTHLLIVDPQNSFCDPEGELYVPNADNDMKCLSDFIENHGAEINRISVTLDSHNRIHIAHPVWWIDADGNNPEPFTQITAEDMESGLWKPANPDHTAWSANYLSSIRNHTVWPYHCIIGTWGHAVCQPLQNTLNQWSETNHELDYYFKGSCKFTEHFSAIKPSISVPDDPVTQVNMRLVNSLAEADTILISGEASSHCVAETVRDIIAMDISLKTKTTLLTNTMSPVPGFENAASAFIKEVTLSGVMTATTHTQGLL